MSILPKRALLAALTVIGLLILAVALWFVAHLGASGSGTFTLKSKVSGVVVLEPSVLNRLNAPVTVTATAEDGGELWIGRTTPSDATAIVGGADHTTVTRVSVRDWALEGTSAGAGRTAPLASADVWRDQRSGTGRVALTVQQQDAPETVVVDRADGAPAGAVSVTMTVADTTWFFQSLLAGVVGLVLVAAGALGLWQTRGRDGRSAATAVGAPHSRDPGAAKENAEVRA